MRKEIAFKLWVSAVMIAEIAFLGGILFWALEEYEASQVENIGMSVVLVSLSLALGALLFSLVQTLRLKSLDATAPVRSLHSVDSGSSTNPNISFSTARR